MRSSRWFAAAIALIAALAQIRAEAFCGFYVGGADAKLFNNATLVVLMREGTRTVLSMQNNYEGPPTDFALVVPVPIVLQKENVKTLPRDVFDRVEQLSAPRLVEYWEQDPCAPPPPPMRAMLGGAGPPRARPAPVPSSDLGVKIEAQFVVGEYEIVILSARDSTGLDTWLKLAKYNIPDGAEPILRPYVQQGMKFFVAKVDPKKVTFDKGQAMLSPLRFHYDSEHFALPVRLGLLNSRGTQDLIVHILAKGQRYEVANFDTVTIPTNIEVAEGSEKKFGEFYVTLFDDVMRRHPNAVVTEYAWSASSCDPCPTPPLSPADELTLGSDALPSNQAREEAPSPRRWRGGGGFTLTRLHARYGKDSLGEDLVFREAPPIVGGREFLQQDGKLEKGAVPSQHGVDNFQARYMIRHPWRGAIACKNPRRGIWGGPPGGNEPKPRPATSLAFVPRGGALASFVQGDVSAGEHLSKGKSLGVLGSIGNLLASPIDSATPADTALSAPPPPPLATPTASAVPLTPPAQPSAEGGCGSCNSGSAAPDAQAWLLLVLALAWHRRRC